MAYVTLTDLRSELGLDDSLDDVLLSAAVTAAERVIDMECGRTFTVPTAATARLYTPRSSTWLAVDDIANVTDLAITDNGVAVSLTAVQLEPLSQVGPDMRTGWPYTHIRMLDSTWTMEASGEATVSVTARWGWAAVPEPVKQACLLIAKDLFHKKDMRFGTIGFGDYGAVRYRMNPMFQSLLAPYRRGLTKIRVA